MENNKNVYDVIICGGGPAGLSAAIYAGRYGLKTLVIEKLFVGGQVITTHDIENYPGTNGVITGFDLIANMEAQVRGFGVEIKNDEITGFDLNGTAKKVVCGKNEFLAKAVILAVGAYPRELGLPNETSLRGAGISYCASCDGFFYKDKTVCVIGGGETAVGDAVLLSKICRKVYLIHRRNEFRASKAVVEKAEALDKIEIILNSRVTEILHDELVRGLRIENTDKEKRELEVKGVFVAIGLNPDTKILRNTVEMNNGYIKVNSKMETSINGVFAAGDATDKVFRQIITAAADGATAAYFVNEYLI